MSAQRHLVPVSLHPPAALQSQPLALSPSVVAFSSGLVPIPVPRSPHILLPWATSDPCPHPHPCPRMLWPWCHLCPHVSPWYHHVCVYPCDITPVPIYIPEMHGVTRVLGVPMVSPTSPCIPMMSPKCPHMFPWFYRCPHMSLTYVSGIACVPKCFSELGMWRHLCPHVCPRGVTYIPTHPCDVTCVPVCLPQSCSWCYPHVPMHPHGPKVSQMSPHVPTTCGIAHVPMCAEGCDPHPHVPLWCHPDLSPCPLVCVSPAPTGCVPTFPQRDSGGVTQRHGAAAGMERQRCHCGRRVTSGDSG